MAKKGVKNIVHGILSCYESYTFKLFYVVLHYVFSKVIELTCMFSTKSKNLYIGSKIIKPIYWI